ncbi:MAG: hypothetical protein JNK82_43060 [Myxococcaceae bacterium]|nr:hypothetical protein [Myxococcaceae bacterium]
MGWLLLSAALLAAPENPHLKRGIEQLAEMDEAGAVRTLEKARAWPKNSPHDLALIHLYLGLAYAGLSQQSKAVDAFRAGLLIEPELELPADASPRIREWWVKAGGRPPTAPTVEPPPQKPEPSAEPDPAPVPAPASAPAVAVVEAPLAARPRSRVPALFTGALGFVALGFGIGGVAHALDVSSRYQLQQPGGPNASSPTVSRSDASMAQVVFPLGIAGAVVGAVLLGVALFLAL